MDHHQITIFGRQASKQSSKQCKQKVVGFELFPESTRTKQLQVFAGFCGLVCDHHFWMAVAVQQLGEIDDNREASAHIESRSDPRLWFDRSAVFRWVWAQACRIRAHDIVVVLCDHDDTYCLCLIKPGQLARQLYRTHSSSASSSCTPDSGCRIRNAHFNVRNNGTSGTVNLSVCVYRIKTLA